MRDRPGRAAPALGRATPALGRAATGAGAASPSERAADPAALAAALDAVVPAEMARRHLPAVVVVVADRDGAILARGFGAARLASGAPVDPARTTFRVASVSKLLTATAVVQLHERGQLSLDADVNTYLRRGRVPATFPEPITLRQLLTHGAGLAERFLGHRARRREEQLPLGEHLARRLPPRFAPPARFSSYANHGMALAGLVVEEVSGKPFPRSRCSPRPASSPSRTRPRRRHPRPPKSSRASRAPIAGRAGRARAWSSSSCRTRGPSTGCAARPTAGSSSRRRSGALSPRTRFAAAGLAAAGLGCAALLARWGLLGYHP